MLSFHITLERLTLIYNSLISFFFFKYYFETGTLRQLFLASQIFSVLEFDSNYFGILL